MSDTPRERLAPALRRTWLFGAGADRAAHEAMAQSGADVLIQDLEDFTPPALRHEARALAPALYRRWREAGALVCVRINSLDADGYLDLQDVMPGRPDIVAYPKSATALHMRALDVSLTTLERALGIADGTTEILPVCETALGVVNVREIAAASHRIRCALLGAEDLATDLCAERSREAVELDHARRRFVLECRAAGIEPVDAPYTFNDVAGAVQEARYSRRLGYRTKSLVLRQMQPIQHLTLDEIEYFNPDWDHAARRVISPPFRNKKHQDSLWAGLQSGSLSVVATDHCAFTGDQKRFGVGDFRKIPNGTGGVEDRMSVLWHHGVGTGRLTPSEFVRVTSTAAAQMVGCTSGVQSAAVPPVLRFAFRRMRIMRPFAGTESGVTSCSASTCMATASMRILLKAAA